ncbi:hypothetical protein [Mycolicibacter hiberniae]|uniref:Uncharacterized protein n=1 Tax=Mycolicibacter hiberniae TaxID=29314 RepID=A0A7I7WZP6_9MYCO|nr:hypothetical protein [Mycolicibacter hiberniae]MCV7086514.1 hypothetical protein [Mycolicibacter hiberniae]ORV69979.1 hypothetical protein AWC09_11265 [Mycolicibacter hiberniae]BBZ22087.1 hypothetical protein MHIB_05050 [Mycolicibacter hiberniae]
MPVDATSIFSTDQQLFYSIVAMNALFSSMAWCAAKPSRWSITAVVVSALIWPFADGALEGDVLLAINSTTGITVSNVFSCVAVVFAFIQTMRIRGAARRDHATEPTAVPPLLPR